MSARAILPRSVHKSPQAFRTISEVADDLGVPQHVLRFWETKFSSIRPLKRGGGRRYYRPEDVNLLKRIHNLLYTEGYTIKGAQKLLKASGRGGASDALDANDRQAGEAPPPRNDLKIPVQDNDFEEKKEDVVQALHSPGALSAAQREGLQAVLAELMTLRTLLAAARA
ncbi:MAG TPA: MerR family transcriptional regulator [Alphaproteobacteria bacterium]|nr:MerR family transcriptional regulator [Alphaproteobacteria bacterium]